LEGVQWARSFDEIVCLTSCDSTSSSVWQVGIWRVCLFDELGFNKLWLHKFVRSTSWDSISLDLATSHIPLVGLLIIHIYSTKQVQDDKLNWKSQTLGFKHPLKVSSNLESFRKSIFIIHQVLLISFSTKKNIFFILTDYKLSKLFWQMLLAVNGNLKKCWNVIFVKEIFYGSFLYHFLRKAPFWNVLKINKRCQW